MPEENKDEPEKRDAEELRKEAEAKSREIEELKKKVEELKSQISNGKTPETPEISKTLEDLSQILNLGFGILGMQGGRQSEKPRSVSGLLERLEKLSEETQSYRKEIDIGGRKGVVDFRVRSGPLSSSDKSTVRPVRHETWKTVRPPVKLTESKEPLVDILNEGEEIKVVAELPGVEKEELELKLAKDTLTIRVDAPTKYYREVKLPTAVEEKIVESTLRNGILVVKLKKKDCA